MNKTNNKKTDKPARAHNGILRLVFVGVSFLLEIGFWWLLIARLNDYASWINIATRVIALIIVLVLYSRRITSAMKTPWIMLILAFPVFGVFLYLLIELNVRAKKMRKRYSALDAELLPLLPENESAHAELKALDPAAAGIAAYLRRNVGFPLYSDSDISFFASAEAALEAQLEELKKAEKFIFMEYFAIENAQSWKRIESILAERARAGVDVRVFYDDLGSIGFVNTDFAESLRKLGIRCTVFNPFRLGLNLFMNNRDHRKITVIDGRVGFTGGYNLADEYFNIIHPYGVWKDAGVMLKGNAVNSLTVSFLEMWNAVNRDEPDSFGEYVGQVDYAAAEKAFVAPYADNPTDGFRVGEDVYINIIAKANDYCWFMTPYLILSDEMISALSEAALRGVDVRIITPGIPDKKAVYMATRSFYPPLVSSGVKIYEWTPGFCHAKMCVADDTMATCGTINLDYRSLYHHFENGCFFSHCRAVLDVKDDFTNCFAQCREVSDKYKSGFGVFLTVGQMLLRLISGLL